MFNSADSGGIASITGSGLQVLKADQSQMLFGSAVEDGFGSMITGGNLWQGYGTVITFESFNHLMHDIKGKNKYGN